MPGYRERRAARREFLTAIASGDPLPAAESRSVDVMLPDGRSAAITAAAQVLAGRDLARPRQYRKWPTDKQDEAYGFYDDTEIVGAPINWQANAVSRLLLTPIKGIDQHAPDGSIHNQLVESFAGGRGGQAVLLKRGAQQILCGGESYLIAHNSESWQAASHKELSMAGREWTLDDGTTDRPVPLPPDTLVIRAWQAHPLKFGWPDCAYMRMLPLLRELRGLTQMTAAQIDSRLAGNGILFLPQSVDVVGKDGVTVADALLTAMSLAIADRSSPESLSPLVATVPDDVIGKIQWLTFSSPLDGQTKNMRDELIRRAAVGADVPPEVVLGIGSTSHWSSFRIAEDSVQLSIIPIGEVLAHALTIGWFRPALRQLGVMDADQWRLSVDARALELRPDRSASALSLYDRQELSGEALRRESGFTEDDKPSEEEQLEALRRKAAGVSGQIAEAVLDEVLPEEMTHEQETTKRSIPTRPGAPVNQNRPGTDPNTGGDM